MALKIDPANNLITLWESRLNQHLNCSKTLTHISIYTMDKKLIISYVEGVNIVIISSSDSSINSNIPSIIKVIWLITWNVAEHFNGFYLPFAIIRILEALTLWLRDTMQRSWHFINISN